MPYLAAIARTTLLAVDATLLAVISARVASDFNVQRFAPRFVPYENYVMPVSALLIIALLACQLVHCRRLQVAR
jgi:hypothetical protein